MTFRRRTNPNAGPPTGDGLAAEIAKHHEERGPRAWHVSAVAAAEWFDLGREAFRRAWRKSGARARHVLRTQHRIDARLVRRESGYVILDVEPLRRGGRSSGEEA